MLDKATVSTKGWVVVPAHYRRQYGLLPGKTVHFVDYGGVLALVPAFSDPVQAGRGLLRGERSLTQALLAEHAQEVARGR